MDFMLSFAKTESDSIESANNLYLWLNLNSNSNLKSNYQIVIHII